MSAKATTSLSNWKFQEQHVQQNLMGGDFAGSHSVILCATAPRLEYLANKGASLAAGNASISAGNGGAETSEFAIPIGVVDTAGLSQSSQLAQIFEIGSKRSYIMRGRTISSLQIARVFYKGPTLLRALYAYYPGSLLGAGNTMSDNQAVTSAIMGETPITMDPKFKETLTRIKNPAGYGNFFLNLDSELFSYPIGLVLYCKDNLDRDIGAVFLQECYIESHQMGVSANSIVIAENVNLRFERIIPLKVQSVMNNAAGGSSDVVGTFLSSGLGGLGTLVNNEVGNLNSQLTGGINSAVNEGFAQLSGLITGR